MSTIIPVFPSLFVKHDTKPKFDDFKESLIAYTHREMGIHSGVKASNIGGWHSEPTIMARDEIPMFSKFMFEQTKEALRPVFKNSAKFELLGSWLNYNPTGSMNEFHNHPECDIAAVLWIDTNEDSGNLEFYNNETYSQRMWHMNLRDSVAEKYFCTPAFNLKPSAGELVLFPANVLHKVNINNSSTSRISLAYNLKIHME